MTLKRGLDIVVALAGLIFLGPLLAMIGLSILLVDGRPAIFRQERIGRDGAPFFLHKFRTMRPSPGAEKGAFDAGRVGRVTGFGRILRGAKLDELPQLWDVLRADMSLVGPRPEVEKWVSAYPERWAPVLTVRPGLTDPASIAYRHEEAILSGSQEPEKTYRDVILPHKLDIYRAYVNNRSLWADIRILAGTIVSVFVRGPMPRPKEEDARPVFPPPL